MAAFGDPEEIQFHLDEVGVGLVEQHVVGHHPVGLFELEVVIVIGKLDAGRFARLADLIEEGRVPFVGVEGPLILRQPGADDVPVADGLRLFKHLIEFIAQPVDADVRRRGCQAELVQQAPDLSRAVFEIARKLDFVIPHGGYLFERPGHIVFHEAANRIELHTDPFERAPGGRRLRLHGLVHRLFFSLSASGIDQIKPAQRRRSG